MSIPRQLADYKADCSTLEVAQLEQKHGEAFLLHSGSIETPEHSFRPTLDLEPDAGGPTVADATSGFSVYPVRLSGRSPFPNFISVGRAENNDIVIPDVSLSKFHAFFRHEVGGGFFLQDAGSQNGTFIDDVPVPSKENGEAVAVRSGSQVRFGRVDLTFLTTEEFRRFVLMTQG